MRWLELVLAAVFAALGIRSFVHWLRFPFVGDDVGDHALFAVNVTCRVGTWFALATLFALYASLDTQGRAFTDDAARYRWFFLVLIGLAVGQLLSGFVLGRRGQSAAGLRFGPPPRPDSAAGPAPEPPEPRPEG